MFPFSQVWFFTDFEDEVYQNLTSKCNLIFVCSRNFLNNFKRTNDLTRKLFDHLLLLLPVKVDYDETAKFNLS